MSFEVEDLSDQRLATWLLGAEEPARVDGRVQLVAALGAPEASRRWSQRSLRRMPPRREPA